MNHQYYLENDNSHSKAGQIHLKPTKRPVNDNGPHNTVPQVNKLYKDLKTTKIPDTDAKTPTTETETPNTESQMSDRGVPKPKHSKTVTPRTSQA